MQNPLCLSTFYLALVILTVCHIIGSSATLSLRRSKAAALQAKVLHRRAMSPGEDGRNSFLTAPMHEFGPIDVTRPSPDKNGVGAAYARFAQLGQGRIILTYQGPDFPIYESVDYGQTWEKITVVKHVDGTHLQPYLYRLPAAIGNLAKDTLLLGGNAIYGNTSEIFIYYSIDKGHSWEYLSSVARGTTPFGKKSENGTSEKMHPVWEPALLLYNGVLACYYSDERDPKHSQKLAHQESTNGVTWGDVIDDVAMPNEKERPGMTNIARMDDGSWILVYEFGVENGHQFLVYFKRSRSPLKFQDVQGHPLRAENGTIPEASPYVAWTSYGGVNGTLIVGAASTGALFLNYAHGEGDWIIYETKSLRGYSPAVEIAYWADNIALIASGAPYGGGGKNGVTFTAVELPKNREDAGPA